MRRAAGTRRRWCCRSPTSAASWCIAAQRVATRSIFAKSRKPWRARGFPEEQIGGTRKDKELPAWDYFTSDGLYSWTKQKQSRRPAARASPAAVWDHGENDWVERKRPADAAMLFNLQTIAPVLAAAPEQMLMVVEGEKDVITATGLGVLATTNADGAGKWRVDDTRTLVALGLSRRSSAPTTTAPASSTASQWRSRCNRPASRCAGWNCPSSASRRTCRIGRRSRSTRKAALAELIAKAPAFDEESLGWRSRLKTARPTRSHLYRGEIPT